MTNPRVVGLMKYFFNVSIQKVKVPTNSKSTVGKVYMHNVVNDVVNFSLRCVLNLPIFFLFAPTLIFYYIYVK